MSGPIHPKVSTANQTKTQCRNTSGYFACFCTLRSALHLEAAAASGTDCQLHRNAFTLRSILDNCIRAKTGRQLRRQRDTRWQRENCSFQRRLTPCTVCDIPHLPHCKPRGAIRDHPVPIMPTRGSPAASTAVLNRHELSADMEALTQPKCKLSALALRRPLPLKKCSGIQSQC